MLTVVLLCLGFGILAGTLAGLFGVGGGVIFVPALILFVFLLNLTSHLSVMSNLLLSFTQNRFLQIFVSKGSGFGHSLLFLPVYRSVLVWVGFHWLPLR